LNGQVVLDFLNVLIAADELGLQELAAYLQKYLIENKSMWIEVHFEFIQQICSKSKNLCELQEFCTSLMTKFPEKILKLVEFTYLSENCLINLIKADELQMKEIGVWERVLKWGLAQNPTLLPDPNTWSDDDFKTMKNTLQHCLPSIRFFSLSSKEFSQKIRPYHKLLDCQLYENLLNSYLDPNSVSIDNILLPRKLRIDEIIKNVIDSKIVNSCIISLVSKWIDKIVINNKFDKFREPYLPYKFKLLLRGSQNGYSPEKFHELCDDKPNTITFIKVKGTEEILGGYNPLRWESSVNVCIWVETKDSFIFSFKNKAAKDAIISYVENTNRALYYGSICGPQFGKDIIFDKYKAHYKKKYYDKKIRNNEGSFDVEDYEVFQIME
jgi:hypothetical protein